MVDSVGKQFGELVGRGIAPIDDRSYRLVVFVDLYESFDRWGRGVHVHIPPSIVFWYQCLALFNNAFNLGLERIGRVDCACSENVVAKEVLYFILILGCRENYYGVALVSFGGRGVVLT